MTDTGEYMNCTHAHDDIFALENLAADSLPADLTGHLASCADCRQLVANIREMEAAARALPVPAAASEAKQTFLQQLTESKVVRQTTPAELHLSFATRILKLTSRLRQPRFALAAAASILLLIGLAGWLLMGHYAAGPADSVVDRLVDWNVDLADAAPAERTQIFQGQADALRQTLASAALPADEQELGAKLLDNGIWLSRNSDPLIGAERFSDVADLLLTRLKSASAKNDPKSVARLSRHLGKVKNGALDPQLQAPSMRGLTRTARPNTTASSVEMMSWTGVWRICLTVRRRNRAR